MNKLEIEITKRNLPVLFALQDNKKSVLDWEKIQKPFWKKVLIEEEYGVFPPVLSPEIKSEKNKLDFAGKLVWEDISFTFSNNEKTHTVPTKLIYPINAENVPFIVYINFRPDIPDRYLPVEEIIDNGFGIFTVCYNDITKDNGDFTDGLAGLFQNGERKGDDAGKIVYWSYMTMRMMDYLQSRKEADKNKIGVAGHSRLGKTALLTAAFDERFSFVFSNDSGCSGAALSRGHRAEAEKLKDILSSFPQWFCLNYQKYIGKEDELPFDQHCLLAMIAPRLVYIGGAIEDVWADNENQFLSCVAASEIWKLYGRTGLIAHDRLPVCGDIFSDGDIGFHLRKGKHFHSRTDWLIYMAALKNKI